MTARKRMAALAVRLALAGPGWTCAGGEAIPEGEEEAPHPAEDVARAFLDALSEERWSLAVGLVDSAGLERWYGQNVRATTWVPVEGRFAGIETGQELRMLSPREAAERALAATAPAYRRERMLAWMAGRGSSEELERLRDGRVLDEVRELVGVVAMGSDSAFAVYRHRWSDGTPRYDQVEPRILVLARAEPDWKVLPGDELGGLLAEPPRLVTGPPGAPSTVP